MKKWLLMSLIGCCFGLLQAQDTLVKISGETVSCILVENTQGYVSYYESDSNALNLLMKNQLLYLKPAAGNHEWCFQNDTIVSKGQVSPLILVGKVLSITPDTVTLFCARKEQPYNQKLPVKELLLIKLSNGSIETFYDPISTNTLLSSYTLGENDAVKYYKTPYGLVVSEVMLGLLVYPSLIGIAVAFVPPKKVDNPNNPNNALLKVDNEYKKGYTTMARKKKTKDSLIGLCSGILTTVAIVIGVNL